MRIISGLYKGRKINDVKSIKTRPTTDKNKEAIFNILGQYFDNGVALDLFSGSGGLGLEAISRGIDLCYFVDKDNTAIKTINENIKSLKVEQKGKVFKMDYLAFLNKFKETKFDLIFLDPPYKYEVIDDIIEFIKNNHMLRSNGIIVCEYSKEHTLREETDGIIEVRQVKKGNSKISFYEWRD